MEDMFTLASYLVPRAQWSGGMPSGATLLLFFTGIFAAIVVSWWVADFTLQAGAVFLTSMVAGGALYFSRD
jgi:hypothetical protein